VIYTRRCTLLQKLRTNTLTTRPCMYCRAFTLRGPVCMCCSRPYRLHVVHCSKIAEAEAAVSVNEKKWLVMHVQLQLDELRGPQTLGSL
jgi:hypothetical protein